MSYSTPSPVKLREYMTAHNLTGSEVGRLVGVDSRAVRRWTSSPDAKSHVSIPWAAWALLRVMMGEATADLLMGEIEPKR